MRAKMSAKTLGCVWVVLSVLLGTLAHAEDPVYFVDPILKAAVEQTLGKNDPMPTDMLAMTSLDAGYKGISSLTGLQYATNLQNLNLRGNQISDISPLLGLTGLNSLDLRGNPLYAWAYTSHIPQISQKNPGITIYRDWPPEVSTYAPSQVTETSAVLEGVVVRDGGLVCEYRFRYWQEGQADQYTQWTGSVSSGATFVERVEGLKPGKLHHVEAQARNGVGVGYGDVRDFSTIPVGFVTLSSTAGGSVTVPGKGTFMVRFGTSVQVIAVARQGWRFLNWTGTAVQAGKVEDPNSDVTVVVVDGEYTLCACFVIIADTAYVDDDAAGDPGPCDPLVSDPDENGSPEHPFDSIQEAVDALDTTNSKVVMVLAGRYTGPGNREIDLAGRPLVVKGSNGPEGCVIDCQGQGRAFHLHSGEDEQSVIEGLTILNGSVQDGGAIHVVSSHPTIKNCVIKDSRSTGYGGGIFCGGSGGLTLVDCTLANNQPEAIYLQGDAGVFVEGTVRLIGNGLADDLNANAQVRLKPNSTLEVRDATISCPVTGHGTMVVPAHSSMTLAGYGVIRLVAEQDPSLRGLLQCDGALHVTDQARITDTIMNLAEAVVDSNAVLSGNQIKIYNWTLSGIRVSGSAKLEGNVIEAGNDQYLTVNPNGFTGLFTNNQSRITIHQGTIFELRAADRVSTGQGYPSGVSQLSPIPDFNTATWTIDTLHVQEGNRLRLADRFNDQQTSPQKGEAMYVKDLILDANSILDVGHRRLYYSTLRQNPSAQVVSQALLGFSLGPIEFEDPNEYASRVATNNSDDPCFPRGYVTLETNGLEGGFMRMQNPVNQNPVSPTLGQVVHARAKARFRQCVEDRVLVRFNYLFDQSSSDLELVAWLSDVPDMLDTADPNRALHYKQVGRVSIPASSWPGSPGSRQYGQFEQLASTYGLDLRAGTWVEMDLVETAKQSGGSVAIDDLAVETADCGAICMDLNWSDTADEEDFMLVMAAYGQHAGLTQDLAGSNACLEGLLSRDGYIDCYDVFSWDWSLQNQGQGDNTCAIPLAGNVGQAASLAPIGQPSWLPYADLDAFDQALMASGVEIPGQLLILGKRGTSEDPLQSKLKDRVYMFDEQGRYGLWLGMTTDRCLQRMVRDGGSLYLLNSQSAVCRFREGGVLEPVVPPGCLYWPSDPRYGRPATVCIGLQKDGAGVSGLPVMDAAFAGQFGYVAPVVVVPEGGLPYQAAAKVELRTSDTPPYKVVHLYDDSSMAGGGQSVPNLNGIREIEVDSQGSVYVINADSHTYSDLLWAHRPDGKIQRLILDQLGLDDPIGLCVSNPEGMVYVGSGCLDPQRPDSTVVRGFSTEDLSLLRKVTIHGMQCVTAIAAHPRRQVLWVVGVGFSDRPLMPSPYQPAFYQPYLAVITPDKDEVQAIPLSGTAATTGSDLALPTSILWTGF